MSAECSRAAVPDGKEDAAIQPRYPGTVPFSEAVACARMMSATSKGGRFTFCAEIARRMQAYEGQIQHLITIPGVDRFVAWTSSRNSART